MVAAVGPIPKKNEGGKINYKLGHPLWDWGRYPNDEKVMPDYKSASWAVEQLKKKHDKPFFLACGLFKPHLAFVAPRKYYKQFPLDEIQLPPHREDDLDDIPAAGMQMKNKGDHKSMLKNKTWKLAIQSYLATCSYADMNVGRLLDALESGPNKDNTIACSGRQFHTLQRWTRSSCFVGSYQS